MLVCDEAVSALDVSIQAQIVDLIRDAAGRVRHVADLHQPRSVGGAPLVAPRDGAVSGPGGGDGRRASLYAAPRHPYTRALLSAVPIPDPRAIRPPLVQATGEEPGSRLIEVAPGHFVAKQEGLPG